MPSKPNETHWKKLHSTVLLRHPRMTIVEDDVELPGGNTTKYVMLSGAQDAVSVIAIKDNKILIQQEYSYPPDIIMYQLPGGGVEAGETPLEAGMRELKEESGYTGTATYLGFYYPRNRTSSNKMHVICVSDTSPCKKEGGDAEEFITSAWIPFTRLRQMIANGEIVNFSILAGLSLYDAKNTTYDKNHSS
jgi:8-oxo-dGTP pyrophosphatase MutT (NUDIX family)